MFNVRMDSSWMAVACRSRLKVSGMDVAGLSGNFRLPSCTSHDRRASSCVPPPPTLNELGFRKETT